MCPDTDLRVALKFLEVFCGEGDDAVVLVRLYVMPVAGAGAPFSSQRRTPRWYVSSLALGHFRSIRGR